MAGISVLMIIVVAVWLVVFLSGRRFGLLGLALAAGSMLSALWARQLAAMLEGVTIPPFGVVLANFVPVLLVIAPAAFLLLRGPRYRGKRGRLLGAILFTLLALTLVAEPLSGLIPLGGIDQVVFGFIEENRVYILTIGLVVAIFDMLKHRETPARR